VRPRSGPSHNLAPTSPPPRPCRSCSTLSTSPPSSESPAPPPGNLATADPTALTPADFKASIATDDTAEVEPTTKEWQTIKRHVPRRILLALRLIEATGLRVSEAADLTFGDVDFAEGRIRVSRARTKRRTAEDRTRERRVFRCGTDEIRKGLALACRDAKIAHYSPRDLRHWRTSLWLAHGFDPITVKHWCGHSRASMTLDVYAHVVTDPASDEWREFWLDADDRRRRPKAAERSPGVVSVWSRDEAAD
jgi:integrase